MDKHWVARVDALLKVSHEPVPHEINELDWKVGLSAKRDRMAAVAVPSRLTLYCA